MASTDIDIHDTPYRQTHPWWRVMRIRPWLLITYLIVGILCLFEVLPLLYVILSSIETNTQINRVLALPTSLYLGNYLHILQDPVAMSGFMNSIIILIPSLLIGVVVSSLAGYAIGRGRGKLYLLIYLFFLSSFMIPVATNLASLYTLVKNLGLLDTRVGLILVEGTGMIPFGVLLYAGFVKIVPRELDEAARIDGCGYFGRFVRVIFPLLRPAIITQIVLGSISIWNDFLIPLLFISSDDKKPLTLAVYTFSSAHVTDYGGIFALLTLALIPPLLFFLFMQKYIYESFGGALKG